MDDVHALLVCGECHTQLVDPITLDCGHTVCTSHPSCTKCTPPPTHSVLPNGVHYFSALLPSTARNPPTPPKGIDTAVLAVAALAAHPPSGWPSHLLDALQCAICHHPSYEPVTTPCQHTFCAQCLENWLDFALTCPSCRDPVNSFTYFSNHPRNRILSAVLATVFPDVLASRGLAYAQSLRPSDTQFDTPIFRCNLAFPGLPTYLHIFEPRYRLLIRRCMNSAEPSFAMMMHPPYAHQPREQFEEDEPSNFGTMLHIRSVQMFPDGRSMVESIGLFRFRLLEATEFNGYQVGNIHRIDDVPNPDELPLSPSATRIWRRIHRRSNSRDMSPGRGLIGIATPPSSPGSSLYGGSPPPSSSLPTTMALMARCRSFLDELRTSTAPWVTQKLEGAYGPAPDDVTTFSFWVALVLPIPDSEKARLLPLQSPRDRLVIINEWIDSLSGSAQSSAAAGCVIS